MVGWVGLPCRLTGWVCVEVAVDMQCRGMLLRGELSLSRNNVCMRARMPVVQLLLHQEALAGLVEVDASRQCVVCSQNNLKNYIQRSFLARRIVRQRR